MRREEKQGDEGGQGEKRRSIREEKRKGDEETRTKERS